MMFQTSLQNVAPLAGAWIEIMITCQKIECIKVAPLAGAWIEIFTRKNSPCSLSVAPLAGAWIEIPEAWRVNGPWILSLPSRERGLKLICLYRICSSIWVAPLAGAWIEIPFGV